MRKVRLRVLGDIQVSAKAENKIKSYNNTKFSLLNIAVNCLSEEANKNLILSNPLDLHLFASEC